jgi:NAD(P)-dependent dehydrogenase (short-subunit alcohol dehydrogenase family)
MPSRPIIKPEVRDETVRTVDSTEPIPKQESAMQRLKNKIAVITGGNSGIGFATAERFVAEGATVVLFGRDSATLKAAADTLGPSASFVAGDVARLEDLKRLAGVVRERHGRIDVLFVNAGVAEFVPIDQVDEAHFDKMFDIDVRGAYFTIKETLPLLSQGASIVLNSSVVSHVGMPGASVYSAAKAAVRSFARSLSAELAPRGIRVNAVAPGPIDTPIFGRMGIPGDQVEGTKANLASIVPIGRMGKPEEVAAAVAFLAADESAYVVGDEISVAGGKGQL